jgi:hypothetical protein
MTFKVGAHDYGGEPAPDLAEEPRDREQLLCMFLLDFREQEDLLLSSIARAEAGETILDMYNNLTDAQFYPDGRVVIEELRYSLKDEEERGPPPSTELTLAETKQLILDWLEVKRRWYAERGRPMPPLSSSLVGLGTLEDTPRPA